MFRILQRHCAVSLPQHGFLVYISIDSVTRSNADITHSMLIFTAVMQNHDDRRKSRHTTVDQNHGIHYGDREYVIIL